MLIVDPVTLKFDKFKLTPEEVRLLAALEEKISSGICNFQDPIVDMWIKACFQEEADCVNRSTIVTNLMHVKILQSICDWMWLEFDDKI